MNTLSPKAVTVGYDQRPKKSPSRMYRGSRSGAAIPGWNTISSGRSGRTGGGSTRVRSCIDSTFWKNSHTLPPFLLMADEMHVLLRPSFTSSSLSWFQMISR